MATNRQKRNGYKGGNHPHSSIKITPNSALQFLTEISTLSVEELTAKYGDLSKLTGYLGEDSE